MASAREIGTEEIVERLKSDEARRLFRDNGILAAYLFGSVAEGRTHSESDIDVAIVFERSVPKSEHFDRRLVIICGLMGLLHVNDVDVVPLNDAPLLLVFQALRHPVRVYSADERRRAEFEVQMIGMYYDFSHVLDEYGKQMFQRIKERGLA